MYCDEEPDQRPAVRCVRRHHSHRQQRRRLRRSDRAMARCPKRESPRRPVEGSALRRDFKRTHRPVERSRCGTLPCRLHGKKSTRPRTVAGLARSREAPWQHGWSRRPMHAQRKRVRLVVAPYEGTAGDVRLINCGGLRARLCAESPTPTWHPTVRQLTRRKPQVQSRPRFQTAPRRKPKIPSS